MTKRDLAAQIRKLAALGALPSAPEAIDVLIEVLRLRCADLAHANRAISRCCETLMAVPKPAELADACEQTAMVGPRASKDCHVCGGSGWEPIYQLHTEHSRKDGTGLWTDRETIRDQPGRTAWWVAHDITAEIQRRLKRGEHVRQYVAEAVRRCGCLR